MRKIIYFIFSSVILIACDSQPSKKTSHEKEKSMQKVSLEDSIETTVVALEANTSIKQVRKRYELKPGFEVKLAKYYLYGDTNQVVKVREEIMSETQNNIIVYYFQDKKLFLIHDYTYKKNCPEYKTLCAVESKYYFANTKFDNAIQRIVTSPDGKSEPQLSQAGFSRFEAPDSLIPSKLTQLENINIKFATLPVIKAKKN